MFFCQAGDGIRGADVTGVQTCALPILPGQQATSGTAPAAGTGFRYRPAARPLCTQPHTGLAAVDDPGAGGNGGTGRFAQLFAPGYSAFRKMDKVDLLIERLISRERQVMENILKDHPEPFTLPGDL